MRGNAVINTTKIGVIGESPNQIRAKIAQIADDTVEHRQDRLEESAERAVRAEQDAAGHADCDRDRKARQHAAQRGEEIDRQIAGLRELYDAREHAFGSRQHIGRHRKRDEPPQCEEKQHQRQALHDDRHAGGAAGRVGSGCHSHD
jgi:hypothetical protein